MTMPVSQVHHRLLRSRTRCGTVRPARLRAVVLIRHGRRDLGERRPGPGPRPHAGPESGRPCRLAQTRIRRLAGTGAEESSAPSTVPPRQRHRPTRHGGGESPPPLVPGEGDVPSGESPAPWTSDNVVTGPADSTAPSAPTGVREAMTSWVSTHRRCAWSEPMSTTESGPSSSTPNWSKTVRSNRGQPVTTSDENSSGESRHANSRPRVAIEIPSRTARARPR